MGRVVSAAVSNTISIPLALAPLALRDLRERFLGGIAYLVFGAYQFSNYLL